MQVEGELERDGAEKARSKLRRRWRYGRRGGLYSTAGAVRASASSLQPRAPSGGSCHPCTVRSWSMNLCRDPETFPHSSCHSAIVRDGCPYTRRGYPATCSIVVANLSMHQAYQTRHASEMEDRGDYFSEHRIGRSIGLERWLGWASSRKVDQVYHGLVCTDSYE